MRDDELDLWKRYKNGDEDAHEKLILHYLHLVKPHVSATCRKARWANREDLMQEGVKGLMTALALYEPESGHEFEAYAQKFIYGAVVRNPEISLMPRTLYETCRKVGKAHDALMQGLEREPTVEEIAERTGLSKDQVDGALNALSIAFAGEFPDYDSESMTAHAAASVQDERVLIQELLSRLGEKARMIVVDYYWKGLTDLEIAEMRGMKKDTVKRNRQRAIKKLGALIKAEKGTEHYEA